MGTMIVTGLLIAGVVLASGSIYRTRKSGKSIQCGGDCASCRGCH